MKNPYEDMLALPRPVSTARKRMSLKDRAAQFAPFAALTGFDASVSEAGRLTDRQIMPGEDICQYLDRIHLALLEKETLHPAVEITYFVPDTRKDGGRYAQVSGNLKKIDLYTKTLILTDNSSVCADSVLDIRLLEDADDFA